MPFQNIETPPGWKGLNDDPSSSSLEPGELSIATNVWRRGVALGSRPGTAYKASGQEWEGALTGADAGEPGHGIVDVASAYDATRFLLGMFNGNVYHDQLDTEPNNPLDKTSNTVQITAGAANWWTHAIDRGTGTVKLYSVGGKQTATVDDFWSWDLDVTSALVDVGGGAGWGGTWPGARCIIQWQNRGYIAAMRGTPANNTGPMEVRFSALGDMDTWPQGNTSGRTLAIGGFPSDGSEYITGMVSYQDNRGQFLLIATNMNLFSVAATGDPFTPHRLNDTIATGCVSQRCLVSLGVDSGDILYLSRRGIHSLRQSQLHPQRSDQYISEKIKETFKTINLSSIENASCGAYDEVSGFVLFAVPTGSNTTADLILALDTRDADPETGITADTARWFLWRTNGFTITALTVARDRSDGKSYVYATTSTGSVCRFQQTDYRDLGSVVPIDMAGRWDDSGAPSLEKTLGDTHLWIGPSADYNPRYRTEFEFGEFVNDAQPVDLTGAAAKFDTAKFDEDQFASEDLLAIRRKRLYGYGSGEVYRWRIQHAGSNEPVFLARVFQEVTASGMELGNVDAA